MSLASFWLDAAVDKIGKTSSLCDSVAAPLIWVRGRGPVLCDLAGRPRMASYSSLTICVAVPPLPTHTFSRCVSSTLAAGSSRMAHN